jgi:glutaminyl-peptide cyclotransferase
VRALSVVLAVQLVLALGFVALVATGALPLGDGDSDASGRAAPRPKVDRFDAGAAWRLVEQQLAIGPRPAGSPASRRLAVRLRRLLPNARFEPVPGGLRNVVAVVPGRDQGRLVVVGAHYDTKDLPGFLGANDGASGTAVVTQIARKLKRHQLRPTVAFVLFDGEESPRGTPDLAFAEEGLRGSRVAAPRLRRAEAMVLLDFVGDRRLRIPREALSDPALWARLRAAARRVGARRAFPSATRPAVLDDHVPFRQAGVPSINLIDFEFACWHRRCDDLGAVSQRSLDAVGETVVELLRSL